MPTLPPPRIAIVGSGPAGCYFAQTLLRAVPTSTITIFDRLVTPFGLIRYGVAADHQHTKSITRQFERLFQSPQVQFAGDIEIGRDVTLDELRAQFDAVVLATGLTADRGLNIAGANLPGIVGAGAITRTLNAHPDEYPALANLGTDVIIIGAGNVALDLLRFLVKGADDYADSDVADAALAAYLAAPAERITLVSRSDAASSKGDPQMIKELATLTQATYQCPDEIMPGPDTTLDRVASARVAAIAELVSTTRPAHDGPTVTLRFGADPTTITGADRVTGLEVSSVNGADTIAATSILTAIGFDAEGIAELSELTASPSAVTGRIEAGLYRTGWAKRGPHGAIPENRSCAKAVAAELIADLATETLVPSAEKLGFEGLPEATQAQAISYAEWLNLDAFEREQAPTGRVRRKLTDHDQMASIARGAAAVATA